MSPAPDTDAATTAVALHLRELPNVALEALIDLVTSAGPQALVLAIAEEVSSRHPQHFRP